jgi:hypothetical protein
MRLNHSAKSTGLVITGLLVLGFVARIGAAAASDCPCIKAGDGVCVPDSACEARERQMRDRPMHDLYEQKRSIAPRSDATMDYRPPTATGHVPLSGTTTAQSDRVSNRGRLRILETGYSPLSELGKEEEGYGLYSYAILASDTRRAAIFLTELFKKIPLIDQTSARPSQLNIFYVPLQKDKEPDFATLMQTSSTNAEKLGADYSRSFYDYRMARALLDHVCNPPADSVRRLCDGDLSRGPYIFTYASPASGMNSVPPPFLFVDLSNVHAQAFGEFIAAFRAQVKRDDITDQARIRTLRLTILDVALTAADWVSPVEKAIADIVHSPSDDEKK